MRPMLATTGSVVPDGPGWVHEVKWDGMRVLVAVEDGRVRVESRNGNDVTVAFPELAALGGSGPGSPGGRDVLLDGEIVALESGVPRFGALAERIHVTQARRAERLARSNPATLMVFDLLRLDGEDLTGLPLRERRAALESLGLAGPAWQVPPTYDDGVALQRAVTAQGLEGILSKRLSSAYHPGRRSREWLKFPHRPRGSYVVGGWRSETGSAGRLGSVLVGEPTAEGLRYRGRVGSGLAGRQGPVLAELLAPLASSVSPFTDEVPKVDAVGTVWVRPEVVVDVESLGTTAQGRLRQPSYRGPRPDLSPADLAPPAFPPQPAGTADTATDEEEEAGG